MHNEIKTAILFLILVCFLPIVFVLAENTSTASYNLVVFPQQGGGNTSSSSYNLLVGQQGGSTSSANYNLVVGFVLASPATGDTTQPTWDTQAQSANSLSQFGELYLSTQAQDETNLTWAYLVTNETGVWINWTDKYGSPQKLGGNTTKQLVNFTWTNFSLEGGQNIGWYIMLNDSTNNTNVTFIQNFSLLKTVSITVANTPAQFSTLQPGGFNSTGTDAGYNPLPFVINNTGNFAANITIEADSLFTLFSNPSRYFQFKSEVNETNSVRTAAIELIANFLNIPLAGSPAMVANMTNFTDANDEVRVHINVTIPAQEPPSNLTSTVTFTASAAY